MMKRLRASRDLIVVTEIMTKILIFPPINISNELGGPDSIGEQRAVSCNGSVREMSGVTTGSVVLQLSVCDSSPLDGQNCKTTTGGQAWLLWRQGRPIKDANISSRWARQGQLLLLTRSASSVGHLTF